MWFLISFADKKKHYVNRIDFKVDIIITGFLFLKLISVETFLYWK